MRFGLRRATLVVGVAFVSGLVGVVGAGGSTERASGSIVVAEAPGASPNYAFPFTSCQYFSVANVEHFQQLMYRPLYWFGLGASSALQPSLSPAAPPVFSNSNTTVTISMRGWHFSNGEAVDPESVAFFLNMYGANPTAYCPYEPGYGIPDDVKAVARSASTMTLTLTSPVNPTWFLYNFLSQLTPMPRAWDKTSTAAASGSGHCGTGAWRTASTNSSCRAVEHFLSTQGANTSTFTGPVWSVVDGPYRISAFDHSGNVTFVPNIAYSGPRKSFVAQVREVAFATQAQELAALVARTVNVGYVDPLSLPGHAAAPGTVGPQLAALAGRYRLASDVPWSFAYAPFNFTRADPAFPLVSQPYLRQVLQGTVSEIQTIRSQLNGYGAPSCSPLPLKAPPTMSSTVGCAYPYNPAKYRGVLSGHGWVVQKGVYVCRRPGVAETQCGKGIARGAPLRFAMIYEAGTASLQRTVLAEVAAWASFGIRVTVATGTLYQVIDECHGGDFAMCTWAQGWAYEPGYYPSGEALMTPHGSFDVGSFSDPKMTSLVAATTSTATNLTSYAQYAARTLPVLYLPVPTPAVEMSTNLRGVLAPSPLNKLLPEFLHY